jgi:hypothetical protein
MAKNRINGYLQWVVMVIAVGSLIWYASGISKDVEYMKIDIIELKLSQKIELELLRDEIKELRLELKLMKKERNE